MSPDTEFFIKLFVTFLLSGLFFLVMMKLQKRKEDEAQKQFERTLKSRGMSPHIEEK